MRFVALVIALSLLAYLPMGLTVGPMHWTTWGPFAVQTSRVLHYLLYFVLGIGVGVYGLDKGLLALDGAAGAPMVGVAGRGGGCLCRGDRRDRRQPVA